MARYLGADDYGGYKLCITLVTVLAAVSTLGLNGGITRFIPMARNDSDSAKIWGIVQIGIGIPFLLGLIITLLVFPSTGIISKQLFSKPELSVILKYSILGLPFLILVNGFSAMVVAFKNIGYSVIAKDFAFNLIKLILALTAILLGFGVKGVTIAYVISVFLTVIIFLYFAGKTFSLKRPWTSAIRPSREIFNFSLPLFFTILLNRFSSNFETIILGFFGVLAEVGIYSIILNLSSIGKMGFEALRTISSPIFAELHSQGKINELKQYYQTITKWSFTFNLPIFLTICLFSENLLIIFGEEFALGKMGLIILASGVLFDALTGACGAVIKMSGYSKVNLIISIFYLTTTIILDFILIPKYGLLGAAWAGALTIVIGNILAASAAYFLIDKLLPFDKSILKPILASLIAGLTTYYLSTVVLTNHPILQLVVLATLMWGIFLLIIFLLKLSHDERMLLKGLVYKFRKP